MKSNTVIAIITIEIVCAFSASIIRDERNDLLGMERITKRSLPEENALVDEPEDLDTAAMVFRPLFTYRILQARRRRTQRSVDNENPTIQTIEPSTDNNNEDIPVDDNDMELAQSSIVFRPLFAYRGVSSRRQRFGRSVDEVEKQNDENDMEGAESSLVFRPLFAYRGTSSRRQRFGRSVDQVEKQNDENDMEGAESSLVFRPFFRYRHRSQSRFG